MTGGSISPETVFEIIKDDPETEHIADSVEQLYDMMTFRNDTNYRFHHFLSKFNVLNYIRWDEHAIDLSVKQICKDLASDNIEYCELRFSIDKYLTYIPWDEHEACLFFLDRVKEWSLHYGISIGPVLSIKHECPAAHAKRLSKLINHWKIAEQLVGIDYVGNEALFGRKRLRDTYRYWKMCGKGLLIHAGEWGSAENVRYAIEKLRIDRISHGVKAAGHPDILKLAIDNDIVFDIAITSNLMTGVVPIGGAHPVVKMYDAGCKITIGTDDPITLDTDLDTEYERVRKTFGIERCKSEKIIEKLFQQSVDSMLTNIC